MEAVRLTFRPGGVAAIMLAGALLVHYAWTGDEWAAWLAAAVAALTVASAATVKAAVYALTGGTVERSLEPMVGGGVAVVHVRVEAPRGIPPVRLRLEDSTPSHTVVVEKPGYSAPLFSYQASWRYRVYLLPGRWCWGKPTLVVEDILGLFKARVVLAGSQCFRVPPRMARPVRRLLEEAGVVGGAALRGRGYGTSFLYTREYVSDDDPRHIEWKATARTGRLVVKVYEREEYASVNILLSLSPGSLAALPGATPYEAAVAAAAALGHSLVRTGARPTVTVCAGGRPLTAARLGSLGALAEALSRIEPPLSEDAWKSCLAGLSRAVAGRRGGGRLVTVILGDERGVDEASKAVGPGRPVVGVVFRGGENPVDAAAEAARRLAGMVRGAA